MRYVVTLLVAFAVACSQDNDHDHDHDKDKSHAHDSKMGGKLVDLDHVVQLEFVLDSKAGKLTAYVWDGHVENAVKVTQETIDVQVRPKGGDAFTIKLAAQTSKLSGNKPGNSSQFEAASDRLKGLDHIEGTVVRIKAKGNEWEGFEFHAGNDDH